MHQRSLYWCRKEQNTAIKLQYSKCIKDLKVNYFTINWYICPTIFYKTFTTMKTTTQSNHNKLQLVPNMQVHFSNYSTQHSCLLKYFCAKWNKLTLLNVNTTGNYLSTKNMTNKKINKYAFKNVHWFGCRGGVLLFKKQHEKNISLQSLNSPTLLTVNIRTDFKILSVLLKHIWSGLSQ